MRFFDTDAELQKIRGETSPTADAPKDTTSVGEISSHHLQQKPIENNDISHFRYFRYQEEDYSISPPSKEGEKINLEKAPPPNPPNPPKVEILSPAVSERETAADWLLAKLFRMDGIAPVRVGSTVQEWCNQFPAQEWNDQIQRLMAAMRYLRVIAFSDETGRAWWRLPKDEFEVRCYGLIETEPREGARRKLHEAHEDNEF